MITRDQYNSALDIVEAYHSQLFKIKTESPKELLIDWLDRVELSTRTNNGLRLLSRWHDNLLFVDDLNKANFLKGKHLGQKSWTEFSDERDYRKNK